MGVILSAFIWTTRIGSYLKNWLVLTSKTIIWLLALTLGLFMLVCQYPPMTSSTDCIEFLSNTHRAGFYRLSFMYSSVILSELNESAAFDTFA